MHVAYHNLILLFDELQLLQKANKRKTKYLSLFYIILGFGKQDMKMCRYICYHVFQISLYIPVFRTTILDSAFSK